MTSDLHLRLRAEASHWDHDDVVAGLLLEAAAEIERLTSALTHLASPNYDVRPTGRDALDMAAFARTSLDTETAV